MDQLHYKWYPGFLKDYSTVLVWSNDHSREFPLIHSLLSGCTGEHHIYTYRPSTKWPEHAKLSVYRDPSEIMPHLLTYLDHDPGRHITFVFDIGGMLPTQIHKYLAEYVRTKREHNTTLIVIADNLRNVSPHTRFDLVFHLQLTKTLTSNYQKLINTANKKGVLITDTLEWFRTSDPSKIPDYSIIGTYIFSNEITSTI